MNPMGSETAQSGPAPADRAEREAVPADARQAAHYIADMVLELRNLSNRANQKFLSYLLEMAYYEAFTIANRLEPTPDQLKEFRNFRKSA